VIQIEKVEKIEDADPEKTKEIKIGKVRRRNSAQLQSLLNSG